MYVCNTINSALPRNSHNDTHTETNTLQERKKTHIQQVCIYQHNHRKFWSNTETMRTSATCTMLLRAYIRLSLSRFHPLHLRMCSTLRDSWPRNCRCVYVCMCMCVCVCVLHCEIRGPEMEGVAMYVCMCMCLCVCLCS